MSQWSSYVRLEPSELEIAREEGFACAVHDPLWFLCRQWQFGEFQGENASSPVLLQYTIESSPIETADGKDDLRVVPAEAILESEVDDWWTMGRRIRLGMIVSNQLDKASSEYEKILFKNPPPPYENFQGKPDGLLVWKKRVSLGLSDGQFGDQIPPLSESQPAWESSELVYQQASSNAFRTDRELLVVDRHLGGRLDWYSVRSADHEVTPNNVQSKTFETIQTVIPTVLEYPGSPNNRWWQFEHADVDISSTIPDDAHTSTALLTELIFSHADDWFLFPVQASTGHVVHLKRVWVVDSFGRSYVSDEQVLINGQPTGKVRWPGLSFPKDWKLFQVEDMDRQGLVLWNVADLPLQSLPIERVQFGIDEKSNLLWALERIIDHRDVECREGSKPDISPSDTRSETQDATKPRDYVYTPARGITSYWHPYMLSETRSRRLESARLADLNQVPVVPMPEPEAVVLKAGAGVHSISFSAIPSSGMEVERRWQLCRDGNGEPVLWIQKQRQVLRSPPARTLRFDLMENSDVGIG